MACVWDSTFAAPSCSGQREAYEAPSRVLLRNESVIDACGVSGAVLSVKSAACGDTGAWAVSDHEGNVSVSGTGPYYVYVPASLPAFVTMPLSSSSGRSPGSVLRVAVPNTAYAASVVSLARPALLYETSTAGAAVTVRSNATSDVIFAQAYVPNATVFVSASPPSSNPPGTATVVWPDARSVPYPLPAIPGVPDATWSTGSLLTIVSFTSTAAGFQSDADALVSSLRSQNVFIGQMRVHVPPAPTAPEPSNLQITTSAVGAWVSVAASLGIVIGTIVTVVQYRNNRRRQIEGKKNEAPEVGAVKGASTEHHLWSAGSAGRRYVL